MPFSRGNPHRDRNILVAAILGLLVVAMFMAGWIYTDAAGRNTASYERWIATLAMIVTGTLLNFWRQVRTERKVDQVQETAHTNAAHLEHVTAATNGALDRRIEEAVERRLSATGQTPHPGQSVNERYMGLGATEEPPEALPAVR